MGFWYLFFVMFRGDAEVRGSGICSLSCSGGALRYRGSGVLCHAQGER